MRWFYLRDEHRNPVACVASDLYTDADKIKYAIFAVSTHNPKDHYNKTMAREVAIGRLQKGLGISIPLVPAVKREIIGCIAHELYQRFPERTKKAARLWLDKHEGAVSTT